MTLRIKSSDEPPELPHAYPLAEVKANGPKLVLISGPPMGSF